jgi:hypothetical protein
MRKPTPDDVRRALADVRAAERSVDEIRARGDEIEDATSEVRRAAKRAANLAHHAHRLSRRQLLELVRAFTGPAPCAVVVDGAIITLSNSTWGMAIVWPERVVTLR